MSDNPFNPIYCIKCKKQIGNDDTFCKHCGQSQAAQAPPPVAPPPPRQAPAVLLPGEPGHIPPPPQQGHAYPINTPPPYPQEPGPVPHQQVVIVEQKNNYTPLIITLLAIFTPLGCFIPLALLLGGGAVLGVLLVALAAVFALWPILLGAAACAVIYRLPNLSKEKRLRAMLISIGAGVLINLLLLAWRMQTNASTVGTSSGTNTASMIPQISPQELKQRRVLEALRTQFRGFRYRVWPGFDKPAEFNESLTRSLVRSVQFRKTANAATYDVSVTLMGNQPRATAPAVYVSLLDEDGRVLSRSDVVDYATASLDPNETRTVDHHIEVPPGATPAFVAIDEDRKVGPPPMR